MGNDIQLEAAVYALLDFIAMKYGVSSRAEFTCHHHRLLADMVRWEPTTAAGSYSRDRAGKEKDGG